MSKFIALMFSIAAGFAIALGNYWFTFGLWPRSWWSFFFFMGLGLLNALMQTAIFREIGQS